MKATRFKRFFYSKIMEPQYLQLVENERRISDYQGAILPTDQSPSRFDIPMGMIQLAKKGEKVNTINFHTARFMLSNVLNIKKSVRSLSKNPAIAKDTIDDDQIKQLIEYSKKIKEECQIESTKSYWKIS